MVVTNFALYAADLAAFLFNTQMQVGMILGEWRIERKLK